MKVWKGRAGVVRQEGDSKWQVLCVRWGNAVLLRVMRKLLMMMLLELQSEGREARAMQLLGEASGQRHSRFRALAQEFT